MYQGLAYQISRIMPLVRATGLLVELFTAQAPDPVLTATGAESGNFVDVPGLVGIACTAAVMSSARVMATSTREPEDILASAPRHVMLDDDYNDLLAGWRNGWRAVVAYPDGTVSTYQITGVETDSQTTHSRLELTEVSV